MIKLEAVVLAVKDIELSKKFYIELFDQKVILDHGINISFDGGFALQQNFDWLVDISASEIISKSCNMELYFEVTDFDQFIKKLTAYPNIKYVHPVKKHSWQQRVVRIFDPDDHMIEIGESMDIVIKEQLLLGKPIEEVSKITQYPIDYIKKISYEL